MRRRMLNPDFFTDPDIVASLNAYGRLLYQGMWCVADDSGCFELNPLLLKMKILPGDQDITTEDIQKYLEKLIDLKKIITYEVDGKKYGWLKNFHKHQTLNKPNSPSVPLPSWITFHGKDEFGNKRHEYYYKINYKDNGKSEDRQSLDSGQTQDRQKKDKSTQEEKLKEEKRSKEKGKEDNKESGQQLPPTPHQKIADLYNQHCPDMPKCIKISDRRKNHLRTRWKEIYELAKKENGNLPRDKLKPKLLSAFEKLFKKAGDSDFMNGENERGWEADFDWMIKNNNNFAKVLEGKYDNERMKSNLDKEDMGELYDQGYR